MPSTSTSTSTSTLAKKTAADVAQPEMTRGGIFFTPRVDIYETADEVVLLCDMPGTRPADLEITFERGELSLYGKVAPRPAATLCEEYSVGDFYRTFSIAPDIDSTRIAAEYADGVLSVHLPKQEQAKPKRIAVAGH